MNIKNHLINWKFILLVITYSAICMILIRHFTVFNTITYDNFKQRHSQITATAVPYTTTSNMSYYSTTLPSQSNHSPTLSRGYTGELNTNSTKKIESYNYKDELYTLNESSLIDSYLVKKANISSNTIAATEKQADNAILPDYLKYKKVHVTKLREFLTSRNSLLAEETYLLTILSVSEDFNLNPLLMFAITGQEQSFVPKSNKNADKIANNPFNVKNSWKKYNTNIQDSATIAANTIVNIFKAKAKAEDNDKLENMDAFALINQTYAEDKNWSKAVRSIFNQLENNVSYVK